MAPPPMGGAGGGPRPMAARGAGSGGSAGDAGPDCQEVLPKLEALTRIYSEMETSNKAKSDALPRLALLADKLRQSQVSATVANILKTVFTNLEENSPQTRLTLNELTMKHWAETKDWVTAFKALVQFK